MKVTVTATGLHELKGVLDDAGDEIIPQGERLVGKGSNQIKQDWKRRWSGLARAGGLPRTISYDVRTTGTLIDGEIGPDLDRGGQAPLGGFLELEYGTRWSAPQPAGAPALEAEAPRFEKALGDLAVKLLEGQ